MPEFINTKVYAGRVKDRDVLLKSSSGGAFTAISDYFLLNGDAVISAVYNYNACTLDFCLIENKAERDSARGSKYMQSRPGEIFRTAEEWLKHNPEKKLLFVGMGCQADGFRIFSEMKRFRYRVYIVDIICQGSSSFKIWKDYMSSLEKQEGKIEYLTFKDKRNGWLNPTPLVVIKGEEKGIRDYVRIFYNRCALRPSCHKCPYTTIKRKTDITIGDFWHIEETIPDFYDDKGTSLFLIHTDVGLELFERIKDSLEWRESNIVQCRQDNLESPTLVSKRRKEFWLDYHRNGIEYIMKKYGTIPKYEKVKCKVENKLRKIFGGGIYVEDILSNKGLFFLSDDMSSVRRAA